MATPDIGKLDLSDSDNEDLFASPSKPAKANLKAPSKNAESSAQAQRSGGSKYDAEASREAALQKELEGVRNINELIEGVLGSLDLAKGNMDTVSQTVTSASTLLNTWIRILSQTEHNQRLILNPNWRGASQDVADMENEQVLKAQAAERRAAEEERRRDAARQRAEDEERQRQAGTTTRARRDMVVEVPQAQAQAQAQAEVGQALEEAFQEGEHEEYDESSKSSKLITATFLHDGITAVPTRIKRYPSHI
ncbi:hypothetical protein EYC84_010057 [Monilinia fructicola]|uniref:DASH complex subunit DUO1 n=1 Tax=Monilinia fructicola TaxID=38448 RepID=A0A5M9JCG5_MONFR|nr:hypothetical protein EYC84_010057 [Monilinia fructicola]